MNASARFTERLRLHQTAAGEEPADYALEEVLAGTGVRFVQGKVARRSRERRTALRTARRARRRVSLGRGDAVIQFTRRDDSPRRWYLTGRAAVIYKETVTRSPLPTFRLLKRGLVPVWAFALAAGRG